MLKGFLSFGQEGPFSRMRMIQFNPITQLKCMNCGSIHTRPHKEGDYIFGKVEEKCPNCGGTSHIITAIYVEDMRQVRPR